MSENMLKALHRLNLECSGMIDSIRGLFTFMIILVRFYLKCSNQVKVSIYVTYYI